MRALVLSSGGNRGALQAGAVEALTRSGLEFDLIVGSSVGAVNGAFLAADPWPAAGQRAGCPVAAAAGTAGLPRGLVDAGGADPAPCTVPLLR